MKEVEELNTIVHQSAQEFGNITEKDWNKKPNPDKWSKKQILGHLIDSALTNLRRFVVTQYEQKQKIVYDQDHWVELQKYQEMDVGECIYLWKSLNLQIARVINGIPEAKLQNLCDTGKETAVYHTLEFLIADYIAHMEHHLNQIMQEDL